jgi:RNA polymerase sigma-70 factor (ECF subfamily)
MLAIGRGSTQAFDALYGRYRRRLYSFLLRYVQDEAAAEDLFQDTFLRLLRAAPGWRPQARLSTWLYRVALNLCVDRSRKRHEETLDPELAEAIPARDADPQATLQTLEALDRLRMEVAGLPAEQRAVLLLRVNEGLGEQEVAEIVGCPVGTVKSRLHYALRRLRARLGAGAAGKGPGSSEEPGPSSAAIGGGGHGAGR